MHGQRKPLRRVLVAASSLVLLAAVAPCIAQTPDAKAGQTKANACAVCHGQSGISTAPDAPHLAGQPEVYFINALKAYRSGERKQPVMNVIAKPLSDQDIADLAAWYAGFELKAERKAK
jgi:cytochrome c553